MKIVVIVLLVMMVACSAGLYYCGKKVVETAEEFSDAVTEEGVDVSNPLGALSALSGLADDVQKMQQELETMEPVDPLPFQTLIDEGLPEAPSGWTARKSRGSSNTMGKFQITQASRRYENQADGKTIDVSITTGRSTGLSMRRFYWRPTSVKKPPKAITRASNSAKIRAARSFSTSANAAREPCSTASATTSW